MEFEGLPTKQVLPLGERVTNATPETYNEYLHCIAAVKPKSARERLSRILAKKVDSSFYTVRKEIEAKVKRSSDGVDPGEGTQAEKLIQIARKNPLFHDEVNDAFTFVNNRVVKIRGSQFKQLLSKIF